ncbi:MAG: precorrin methylase [Rhodobacteraceae bacterium]|uniref:Cobalt-precorrin 5A hydrolase n=1 Tax=Salipiger profundus TaxID=1229727 RepID=A0A1U7DC47_9RHOB|nr:MULTISPECIES: cobalamin biosynthesis protein [Salipiger]APX25625.1 cobalt-precorrin 5A hydrolase [Salipiger profundus]MAB06307.1 precorrin methylase [Paracoccaceae bacterium]GGA04332.1 hypothetical protein GCM10011326_14990 [Salipiger profundus]SFD53394.1 cobalt-precorrin 5A hydrolase [Salipiger profundus]
MIVAGFGFRTSAGPESLRDALARAGQRPQRIATAEDKATSRAFIDFAQAEALPAQAIPPDALTAQVTLTASSRVLAERGTGSVAEAAALAAAGPGARLLGPRVFSSDRMASCALALQDLEGQDT